MMQTLICTTTNISYTLISLFNKLGFKVSPTLTNSTWILVLTSPDIFKGNNY